MLLCALMGCRTAKTATLDASLATDKASTQTRRAELQDVEAKETSPSAVSAASYRKPTDLSVVEEKPLTLEQTLHLAMSQSEIIRTGTVRVGGRSTLLVNPQAIATAYDQQIRQTGVLFGDRSVAAARTDFDPELNFDGVWGEDEKVQNSLLDSGGIPPGGIRTEDTSNVNLGVRKRLMTGGEVNLNQSVQYLQDNVPGRLFQSAYSGAAKAEFRQPILAGAGYEYNSIAGPLSGSLKGITGVQQGIVIARINEHISALEFQRQLQDLLHEVEVAYWRFVYQHEAAHYLELALAEAEAGVVSAERRAQIGEKEGSAVDVSEARILVFDLKSQHSQALSELSEQESILRRLLNLPPTDGTFLVPADSFSEAEFAVDQDTGIESALTARIELLAQKQQIRSLQLQLNAARKVNAARLDFISSYSANAFGDDLLGAQNPPGSQGFGSAAGSQFRGDQTGWTLGFQFERPLGLRLGKLQVTNLELRVAKAHAILNAQESEIRHEVYGVLRQLNQAKAQMINAKQRGDEVTRRVEALVSRQKADPANTSTHEVIQAHRAVFDASTQVNRYLMEYHSALADWHRACGTTLAANSTVITDGNVVVQLSGRMPNN